jgi:hypothetical protein
MKKILYLLLIFAIPLKAQYIVEDGDSVGTAFTGVNDNATTLFNYMEEDSTAGYVFEKSAGISYSRYYPTPDSARWIVGTNDRGIDNQYKTVIQGENRYNNTNTVSKIGGILIRTDNWYLWNYDGSMYALINWLSIWDKYGLKVVLALNENDERLWMGTNEKYAIFWRNIQANGHEIADHGMTHSNFNYVVPTAYLGVNANTDGILTVKDNGNGTDSVVVDTTALGKTTEAGFNQLMKRGQRLFEFIGLKPFTYFMEGGGQLHYHLIDSVIKGCEENGIIGGSLYNDNSYRHDGYSPPVDWGKRSAYSNRVMDATYNIQLENIWNTYGTQHETAKESIKQITDMASRNEMTTMFLHVQIYDGDDWFYEVTDSIARFLAENKSQVLTLTASEWSQRLYYSQTNPYENVFPHNTISNLVLEDNIDGIYGDDSPDGWILNGTASWATNGGSQESNGYCIVGTTGNSIECTRLMGIEKGLNQFVIDIKDNSSSDSVFVEVKEYYGTTFPTLTNRTTTLKFGTTAGWVTTAKDITINKNTSYADIKIYCKTGTAYIDEVILRKKY